MELVRSAEKASGIGMVRFTDCIRGGNLITFCSALGRGTPRLCGSISLSLPVTGDVDCLELARVAQFSAAAD